MNSTLIVLLAILGPLFLSSYLNPGQQALWYNNLNKSQLTPPNWVFAVVWPILYLMMGIAYSRIITNPALGFTSFISIIYLLQLYLNLMWSYRFFKNRDYEGSFLQLLLIIALVGTLVYNLLPIDKTAAYLLIPYLSWLIFASYLNGYIYWNN